MRITDIHIKNYRAFYGEHHICLDKEGKNLMVYGENGSEIIIFKMRTIG